MQTRRLSAMPPLAIPRRRSSRSLLSATSPHTPRSCGSPTCSSALFFAPAANRKSTDSWNSSNQDQDDDQECEWKTEQTLLLSRVRATMLLYSPIADLSIDSRCTPFPPADPLQWARATIQSPRQDRPWRLTRQRPQRVATHHPRNACKAPRARPCPRKRSRRG
jgi:hypothetical protein